MEYDGNNAYRGTYRPCLQLYQPELDIEIVDEPFSALEESVLGMHSSCEDRDRDRDRDRKRKKEKKKRRDRKRRRDPDCPRRPKR